MNTVCVQKSFSASSTFGEIEHKKLEIRTINYFHFDKSFQSHFRFVLAWHTRNIRCYKALSRTAKDGSIRLATYDSIEHYTKKLADTHKVPALTVLNCMRQQIYNLYQDDTGELSRMLKIVERLQDSELKAVV